MSSKEQQARYAIYKSSNKFASNQKLKLERHLKNHPNDVQSLAAKPRTEVRRCKPSDSKTKANRLHQQLTKLVKGALNAYKFQQKNPDVKLQMNKQIIATHNFISQYTSKPTKTNKKSHKAK